MARAGSATSSTVTPRSPPRSGRPWASGCAPRERLSCSQRRSGPWPPGSVPRVSGIVYLVGAGPGDPGLMTRRSLELIASADAILYDRLIPPGALEGARPDAELRYVGKEPGAAAVTQEETTQLLVELGRAGKRVVRLKGGDPFVFGRGGEEAEALAAAGVPFEVVPGVTAGVAAPAYAGIPVTHRDAASAVAFVTGHEDPDKPETALDWDALARFPGTLVLYMGIKNLPLIAERLTAAGRDPEELVAVVERGTLPGQRTVVDTLAGIAARVEQEGIRPPAITLVGAGRGAARHDRLAGAAAASRRGGGGHTRPRTGERAGGAAAGARCRGGRDAGDPDRAATAGRRAARGRAADRRLRPRLPHEPERSAPAVRRARGDRPRRPRPRRGDGGRDRTRHRRRARTPRSARGRGARAVRGRGARGGAGAGGGRGAARARRSRGRGAQRAAGRPARPRRGGGRRGSLRDGGRAARGRRARARSSAPPT